MKFNRARALIGLAVLAAIGCDSGQRENRTFGFRFRPADSTTFIVEVAQLRTTSTGDQQTIDSTWSRTSHLVRTSEPGYDLSGVTDSIVMYRDGEVMADRVVNIFSLARITYVIDTTGLALSVSGYEEIFAGLDSLVGTDTAEMIRKNIDALTLQQQEVGSWNAKFSIIAGHEFRLGVPSADSLFPNLPVEGQLTAYTLTEIIDTVRINGNLCGRVLMASSTNPTELAEMTDMTVAEVATFFGLSEAQIAGAGDRQAGTSFRREWTLEFETMLTHSESSRQVMYYYELSPSGLPIRHQLTEIQTKEFIYPELVTL